MPKKPHNNKVRCFSFGEPESALDSQVSLGLPESVIGNLYDSLGTFLDKSGEYYVPPIDKKGLGNLLNANSYHGAIPSFKANLFMRDFIKNDLVGYFDLERAMIDFQVFGECYFFKVKNIWGKTIKYKHMMAINMRVKTDDDFRQFLPESKYHDFYNEDIVHIKEYDVLQNIYGRPYYIGLLQALLLNEAATIFKRRYYLNGAHAGYVFYVADPDMTEEDEEKLKTQIANSKGAGNFRSLFVNIPKGNEKSIQILPIGDFSSKDDMINIKNITKDEIIAAWRVPPILANIIPSNTGGLGDVEKYDRTYMKNEIMPIRFKVAQYLPIEFREVKETNEA